MSSLGKAKSFATASDINPPGKGRNRLRREFRSSPLSPYFPISFSLTHLTSVLYVIKKKRGETKNDSRQNDWERNAFATPGYLAD